MSPVVEKTATQEEVESAAAGHLRQHLGNRLWPGAPVFDARRGEWLAPIHSRSLPPEVGLGEIVLNARAEVVRAPSRRALQRAAERYRAEHEAARAPEITTGLPLAFALRGPARGEGEALALADLPDDPAAVGREVLADPDLKQAYQCLKHALADPQMRGDVMGVLEALARAARGDERA
jgi:hypothetical protein